MKNDIKTDSTVLGTSRLGSAKAVNKYTLQGLSLTVDSLGSFNSMILVVINKHISDQYHQC